MWSSDSAFKALRSSYINAGHRHVALRLVLDVVQQAADGLQARLLLHQAVVGHALEEQQRGRIDHLLRLQAFELHDRFLVQALLASQRPKSSRRLCRTKAGRASSVSQANSGSVTPGGGLAAELRQGLGVGIGQREGFGQPLEQVRPALRRQSSGHSASACSRIALLRIDRVQPFGHVAAHLHRRWRLERRRLAELIGRFAKPPSRRRPASSQATNDTNEPR